MQSSVCHPDAVRFYYSRPRARWPLGAQIPCPASSRGDHIKQEVYEAPGPVYHMALRLLLLSPRPQNFHLAFSLMPVMINSANTITGHPDGAPSSPQKSADEQGAGWDVLAARPGSLPPTGGHVDKDYPSINYHHQELGRKKMKT